MTKLTTIISVAIFALSATASIFETNDLQRANLNTVAEWTKANDGERGLLLDKEKGEVIILAEHCDISAATTIEFPIVGELSDRDYEALFRTFAKPSAIGKAIEALGVPRGHNVNFTKMDFWPVGHRLTVEVAPFAATNTTYKPIQYFIIDAQARSRMTYDSFIYCGSCPDPEDPSKLLCDTLAPNSVISTYNEPQTLIDLPARCSQSEVYERFQKAKDSGLVPFGLYKIRIRPVKDEARLPKGYLLLINKDANGLPALSVNGEPATNAETAIKRLYNEAENGADVYMAPYFSSKITVEEAIAFANILDALNNDGKLRIVGSHSTVASLTASPNKQEGDYCDLYYKSFIPNQKWRKTEDRPSQPWTVHFGTVSTNEAAIKLVKTLEDWTSTDSLDPILSFKEFTVNTPEEALATMEANGHGLPVILAFAPSDWSLSKIMPTLSLLKDKHPTLYIFGEAEDVKNEK